MRALRIRQLIVLVWSLVWLSAAATLRAQCPSYMQVVPPATYGFAAGGFTFECWVKIGQLAGYDPRIVRCIDSRPEGPCGTGTNDLWELSICKLSCATGTIDFNVTDEGTCHDLTSSASINDGQFHHVAATYDGQDMRIYIDSLLSGTLHAPGMNINVAGGVLVLGQSTQINNAFYGWLDEIRVWKTARTQSQIQANLFNEIGTDANLVAYWRLNGDGSDLIAGHTLSLVGGVSFGAAKLNLGAHIDTCVGNPVVTNRVPALSTVLQVLLTGVLALVGVALLRMRS